MTKAKWFLFTLAIYLGMAGSLLAAPPRPIYIHKSPGGSIVEFMKEFQRLRHRRFIVDGDCASACTLVLALPHMCATPTARFGFHQAWNAKRPWYHAPMIIEPAPIGNEIMLRHYPQAIKAWINRQGGLPFGPPIWLGGYEMQQIVPQCQR